MSIGDVDWRLLFEQLLAEQPATPLGGFIAVLEFGVIFARFTEETST